MAATAMLDAAVLRAWADGAVGALAEHRAELDALNVFPVADSDTGTNLYLTLREARQALGSVSETGGTLGTVDTARLLARGALVGARGNSGVIVSQYLGALLRALPPGELTGELLARGLRQAADAAWRAVARPVEGTVLSVAHAVAEGAERAVAAGAAAGPGPSVPAADVLDAALAAGTWALGRTPAQLAPLRAAGVLDAGAWGLLLVLGAFAEALGLSTSALARPGDGAVPGVEVCGEPHEGTCGPDTREPGSGCRHEEHAAVEGAPEGGAFEVMFVVSAPAVTGVEDDELAERLRAALARTGDSVAVVGGDGLWQAHVHTDSPLAAVATADLVGVRATQVRVRHIASQAGVHGTHTPTLGVVAVTGAAGLAADVARAGAVVVLVPPGQVAGPELERAVDDTGAATVLVLAAAGLVVSAPDRPGTRVRSDLSEVQVVAGAATLATLAPDVPAETLAARVLAAVDGVRTAVAEIDGTDLAAARAAVGEIVDDGTTLLTVLAPQGAPEGLADELAGVVGDRVEVVLLSTGLPGSRLVLGAETEQIGTA